MSKLNAEKKLTNFMIDGKSVPVNFVETQTVKEGVECDIYNFTNDDSRDLAIVRVQKGYKTPLQRILLGIKTTEGFISGTGTLTVGLQGKEMQIYEFNSASRSQEVIVTIGQTMQWFATESDLRFYEICSPPYQDGRFENLPE